MPKKNKKENQNSEKEIAPKKIKSSLTEFTQNSLPTDKEIKKFDEITRKNFTDDEGLTQGIAYYYRVQAVDRMGNLGSLSSIKRILNSASSCGIDISIEVPEIVKAGNLDIEVVITMGEIKNGKLSLKLPGENYKILVENKTGSRITKSYTIPEGISGTLGIFVEGKDENNKPCEGLAEIEVDSVKPEIEIVSPTENEEIKNKIKIITSASDEGKEIEKVEAFVNNNSIGILVKNGDNYEIEWDTAKKSKGTYTLKVVVSDKAGNISEKEINIKVNNIDENLYAEKDYLAKTELEQGLKNSGVKENLIETAKKLIEETNPKRSIEVRRTGSGIEAVIHVSIKNTGTAKNLQIIESIPKSVVSNANLISSAKEFTILQADPILRFNLGAVAEGEEVNFSYTIGKALTESQADSAIEGFDSYETVPIVLEENESEPIQFTGISDMLWIGFIIIILIFVLIIGIIVFGGGALIAHKVYKSSSNEPETAGLHTAYRGHTTGFADEIKNMLKPKEKEKSGKFAFRKK